MTDGPALAEHAPAARWLLFAIISAIYFTISAATFSSLGIVLPYMIKELSWSWSQAGTGCCEAFRKMGTSARRAKHPADLATFVDASAIENEDIVHPQTIFVHSGYF